MQVSEHLGHVLDALMPAMDIAQGRVESPDVPVWCEARGWTSFLLGLTDEELLLCERAGLSAALPDIASAPLDLRALARDVSRWTSFAPAGKAAGALRDTRHISVRKQAQLQALLASVAPMAKRAARIVDVGAGRGHFTRLAADLFECMTIGLERELARVSSAERLAEHSSAIFKAFDANREAFSAAPDDLLIGLHACGVLGDRMVAASCETGCDLVLVSCCLQKIEGPAREPLSKIAKEAGFRPLRADLGLSNLSARGKGVETGLEETLKAREARYALRLLLLERGLAVDAGGEMRGLNRRMAHKGTRQLAEKAFGARGLALPSDHALRMAEQRAALAFQRMRRLSLPRAMLSRPLEAAVVLDRAAALMERGHRVRVLQLFSDDVSPRNLGIFAEAARA